MPFALEQEPVQWSEFSTTDQGEAVEFVSSMYAEHRPWFSGGTSGFEYTASTVETDGMGLDCVRCSMTYRAEADPMSQVVAVVARSGVVGTWCGGDEVRASAGEGVLYPIGSPFWTEITDNASVMMVRLPLDRVAESAAAAVDGDPAEVRFPSMVPISPRLARVWRSTVESARAELMASDPTAASPLVAEQLAEMTIAALLAAFPNTTMTLDYVAGGGSANPAAVRRAVGFIDANADQPIELADIAAAAGVSPRALQSGFVRHRDSTPVGYLRLVRLERARRNLQDGTRMAGDSVAGIGRRWGFAAPSQFATVYTSRYGESPDATLDG
jgi:AraC-like DNA-binding protein